MPQRAGGAGAHRHRVGVRPAIALCYAASIFLGAMDNHIVNVALPTLTRDLHTSIASTQWTVIGYVLSLALWIPASGWIGDRFGTKRTFLFAISLFTVASALCGQAHSLGELIAFRVLQGAGGGMLAPTGTAMLFRAYPPEERARMARLLTLPILLGPAMAPVVGGLLIQTLSWRWVFYVNLPFGVAVFVLALRRLPEHTEAGRSRFDVAGFALGGGGLALVLYALSQGPLNGWGSASVLGTGIGGLVLLVSFVQVEGRIEAPILRIHLLRERLFGSTNAIVTASTGAFLGFLYLSPIFLQEVRGQSALNSGLTTFVEAFGVVISSQTVGRFYPRIGPRRLCAAGLVGLVASLLCMQAVGTATDLWSIRAIMFATGFTNGACFLALQTCAFSKISKRDTGHAAAIFNANRQTSLAASVAVLSTIVVSVHGPRLAAFHYGFLACAVFAAVGVLLSLALIHDEDAAATLAPTAMRVRVAAERGVPGGDAGSVRDMVEGSVGRGRHEAGGPS